MKHLKTLRISKPTWKVNIYILKIKSAFYIRKVRRGKKNQAITEGKSKIQEMKEIRKSETKNKKQKVFTVKTMKKKWRSLNKEKKNSVKKILFLSLSKSTST